MFSTMSPGIDGKAILATSIGGAGGSQRLIAAFGANSDCTIFSINNTGVLLTTTLGVVDNAPVLRFSESNINDDLYILFGDSNGSGWFVSDASITAPGTFTASVVSGATTLSSVSSFAGIEIGQKLAGTGVHSTARVSVIDTSNSRITMTVAANANAAATEITRERIAKIIDDQFTTLNIAGSFCDMDGYVFIAATDNELNPVIANSDINAPWSWSAANIITPNIADNPCGVVKYRDHIVWIGSRSIQFFFNAGNPNGSILSQNDALTSFGVGGVAYSTNGYSPIINLGGTVYWIGANDSAIAGVYRLNGFSPENIANASVTRKLIKVLSSIGSGQIFAFDGFSAFGMTYLYIALADVGYLYCVETNLWTEAGFFSGGMRISSRANAADDSQVAAVRLDGGNGEIYEIQQANNAYMDDGASYTMAAQTPNLVLNDGNPFTVHEVELIGDTQSSGFTTLSSFSDDYGTAVIRGAFDMTNQRKVVKRCGYHRTHVAFKLEHSASTAWRAQAIKVRWSPAVGREI